MIMVQLLLLSGAMPSSIAITLDVLATANRVAYGLRKGAAFAVRLDGSGARAAGGLARSSGLALDTGTEPAALVIVPGLGTSTEGDIVARLGRGDARLAQRTLVEAAARGAALATSCSGAFLLAETGLLDGKRATSTWWLAPIFRRMFPRVTLDIDALVVTDGAITTAGAAMAQLDLMLTLVARHAGPSTAEACARYLLLDARHSQSRYMAIGYLTAADAVVARAEGWARERLEDGFSVDDLAKAAGLSPRTFARRVERATGLSPVRFVQRLRVEKAVDLLETTRLPFEEIARRVGYAEPTTLRRVMHRDAGRSPRDLRLSGRTGRDQLAD